MFRLKTKNLKLKKSGFTLIEVVISILLFSIMVSSVLYYYNSMIKNTEKIDSRFDYIMAVRNFLSEFDFKNDLRGEQKYGKYLFKWDSQLIEKKPKYDGFLNAYSPYQLELRLFKVEISEIESKKIITEKEIIKVIKMM